MTSRMRMQLLLDTVNRHKGREAHAKGECCLEASLAAAEVIRIGMNGARTAPEAPAAPTPEPVKKYRAQPGRAATVPQLRYLEALLKQRDVSNYFQAEANRILRSDNPLFDDASRTIEQMVRMPKLPEPVREATPRQVFTVSRLLEQRIWPDEVEAASLNFQQARDLIGALLEAPKKTGASSGTLPEVGIYLFEGEYYKIQVAVHGSGRRMCKKLDLASGCFKRQGGMSGKLTAEHRVTVEQAREFGALYGQCVCCGAVLTDDAHAKEGIGPVCKKKYF
jgi:hypothetical protein